MTQRSSCFEQKDSGRMSYNFNICTLVGLYDCTIRSGLRKLSWFPTAVRSKDAKMRLRKNTYHRTADITTPFGIQKDEQRTLNSAIDTFFFVLNTRHERGVREAGVGLGFFLVGE